MSRSNARKEDAGFGLQLYHICHLLSFVWVQMKAASGILIVLKIVCIRHAVSAILCFTHETCKA